MYRHPSKLNVRHILFLILTNFHIYVCIYTYIKFNNTKQPIPQKSLVHESLFSVVPATD